MSNASPPRPDPLRRRDRWRLRRKGRHDRGVDQALEGGHTPYTLFLLAICKRGELEVLNWLIERRNELLVPDPQFRSAQTYAPADGPPNFPTDVWERREAAAFAAKVRSDEDAYRAAVARSTEAASRMELVLAEAQVAASDWAAHFHEMATIYARARLAVRRDLAGWIIPPYHFESEFDMAPVLVPGASIIRHPHLVKEDTDVA